MSMVADAANRTASSRVKRGFLLRLALAVCALTLLAAVPGRADDEVPVPGGPAAVRRLLGLDPTRPPSSFFFDVHEILVFATGTHVPWKEVERRKLVVEFAENLAEWKAEFGDPAVLSTAAGDWKKTRAALEWLGIKVKGDSRTFTMERRDDARSIRRQGCVEALGTPVSSLIARLKAGERVEIAAPDRTAPLPFGLAVWRDTLEDPSLSAAGAFVAFVKNVRASRMLVALHAIDPETREELRTVFRDGKGRAIAWRILYDKVLDAFGRYPEALMLRDGRFVLPGGKEAEPVWAEIVGVSPSDRIAFLPALFLTDSGKAAYVAAVLQQLPDALARELLLGRTGGGPKAVKRFRRLYRSIDPGGVNYELVLRDPYDFAHLARFLKLSDDGDLLLPPATFEESAFPRDAAELASALGRASRNTPPEEYLRRLFRSDSPGSAIRFPAQRRFLFVSSLLERRPDLADPSLLFLLASGLDRFWPAYAVFDDLPLDASLARRYLFTLDRLDRRSPSRASEVAAGLFQGAVELLAQIARAGTLPPEEVRRLAALLFDLPLFARDDVTPAQGEGKLYGWLSGGLLASLRSAEARAIEIRRAERTRREGEYREAVRDRNARIETRLAAARAREDASRTAADAWRRSLFEPGCSADDEIAGPPAPAFFSERRALEEAFAASGLDPRGAETWLTEALEAAAHAERQSAATSALPVPARRPAALPGTFLLADPSEPAPELVATEVPEPSATSDDLLTEATVGRGASASFEWRGGRYRFDPCADDAARRRQFREKQRLVWLAALESLHARRDALVAAAAAGDPGGAKTAVAELSKEMGLFPAERDKRDRDADKPLARDLARARDASSDLSTISKPKQLPRVAEQIGRFDAVLAERHLEAYLGHVYASYADPEDLYYQDADFVRRHAFHPPAVAGKVVGSAFARTALVDQPDGGGSRVTGSLFGLADALGLLHADQVPRKPGASIGSEEIRSGIVAAVHRMSAARLDDDALTVVAASCHAAEELVAALASVPNRERARLWTDLARDIVPRSRLSTVASFDDLTTFEDIARELAPSDLYLIGRRLALGKTPAGVPDLPSAVRAREAFERLRSRFGESGARDRLAQFGPRAAFYAGRFCLTDLELPPFERLADYRTPQLLADRLYDLKISVARRVSDAGLPAAVLPIVLSGALDETLGSLKMAFAYNWAASVRAAHAFSSADVDRLLDGALRSGRLMRDQAADEAAEAAK
jgi:hypothetical protein